MEAVVSKNTDELWESFLATRRSEDKSELIMNYIWLVKFVLSKMNLPQNTILDHQDFVAIGVLGLHETIERFSLDRGVKFETYAIPRIKGIIKDEMRKLDWLSRSTRKKAHEFRDAAEALRNENGREVSSGEIMQRLNVDSQTYLKYLSAAAAAKATVNFNDNSNIMIDGEELDIFETVADEDAVDSLESLAEKERMEYLIQYIQKLKQKPRLVMSLYYYEEMTFKEIGKNIELTESRVCQIHTQVIKDIRKQLKQLENA
ncbi:FliA/WhiG family RNA polymerase sigma factor [Candidatus Kapabacteria bacterium]|nr:FliA/WhiG family RNA polymerase sigma factor [Candidatus Kapabacteria bacterium]